MDCLCLVRGVAKSRIRLSDFHFPSLNKCLENFAFNIDLCSTLSKMDFRDHHT